MQQFRLRSTSSPASAPAAAATTTETPSSIGAKKKVLILTGPTGTGKTSLSIELAKQLNAEIVSL